MQSASAPDLGATRGSDPWKATQDSQPWHPGNRAEGARARQLPREGPSPGDGCLKVHQRGIFETIVKPRTPISDHNASHSSSATSHRTVSRVGTSKRPSLRSSALDASKASMPSGNSRRARSIGDAGSSVAMAPAQPRKVRRSATEAQLGHPEAGQPHERYRLLSSGAGQEDKKYADLFAKWEKNEARCRGAEKKARERNADNAEQREERFHRLLHVLTENDSLVSELGTMLKEQDAIQVFKARELHAQWEEKVYGPLTAQAHAIMNPSYRPVASQLRHQGVKGRFLDFKLPGRKPVLLVNGAGDPVKRQLVDDIQEKVFQHAAGRVISGCHSSPDLFCALGLGVPPSGAPAVTRPVIDPTEYCRVNEHVYPRERPGGQRRGIGKHGPDESDGVHVAGTRRTRADGHHNKGILHGTRAMGESVEHKRATGAGSGAPAQDHYGFKSGRHITDLEFPLGKRVSGYQIK